MFDALLLDALLYFFVPKLADPKLGLQENSAQTANGVSKDSAQAPKASSKEAPSCLDGLWDILQHSRELEDEHTEVLAHTLHVMSVMWQVVNQ